MAGFSPPDYIAPLASPPAPATEVDGVLVTWDAPPAAPPAPATEVDGVPVDWDAPLAVPSGSATEIGPHTRTLTVVDASPAVGETWSVVVNGTTVTHTVVDTDPGAPVVPQTQNQIAAALELLIEALPGVSASVLNNVVTVVPAAPLSHVTVSSPATSGGGSLTLASSGTAMNFNPQPVPDATPGTEVDGVPVSWDPPAAAPDGGAWVLTES